MHNVKCKYCGVIFDRDKVECVKVGGRRYAHVECNKKQQESLSKEMVSEQKLNNYIKELFGDKANWARIKKQIKQLIEDKNTNYNYDGIRLTLKWWFEVKGNSIDKANGGIGIVPYVYNDAAEYYFYLDLAKMASQSTPKQEKEFEILRIRAPKVERKRKKLFWEDEDE